MNAKLSRRRIEGRSSSTRRKKGLSMLQLLAGCAMVAVSFNMFLLPNGIASGGVSGISISFKG